MTERAKWTKSKLEKYIKEGRGIGEGRNYKPWTTVYDYSSYGRSTRILGYKTKRVHHLNSDLMTNYFYLMEWDNRVIDIRETYPLIDAAEILSSFDDLRFDLFKDKVSGFQYILTTSFLLVIRENGKERMVARTLKMANDLNKSTVIEKIEIERRYWKSRGINWGIVTDKELPIERCKNIKWIHSSLWGYEDRGYKRDEVIQEAWRLIEFLCKDKKMTVRRAVYNFDDEYLLDEGTGLYLLKYAIAAKFISIDIDKKIDLNESTDKLITNINYMEEDSIASN